MPPKASSDDFLGRFREIVSDPINLLIERIPNAGVVEGGLVQLHNGNRVPLSGQGAYYEGFSDILVINRGVHEPLEEFVFQEMLKALPERPSMIELGAYWAHYSMWLKRVRREAAVTMVEPDGDNLRVGKANFDLNGFEGEFIQASVQKGSFEVDAFLAERGLPKLNILHSDIQGYEVEMLDGCSKSLAQKRIDFVFISTHSQDLHYKVAERMTSFEYRIEISSDFELQTTSFDGLIFASSPLVAPVCSRHWPFARSEISDLSPPETIRHLSEFVK